MSIAATQVEFAPLGGLLNHAGRVWGTVASAGLSSPRKTQDASLPNTGTNFNRAARLTVIASDNPMQPAFGPHTMPRNTILGQSLPQGEPRYRIENFGKIDDSRSEYRLQANCRFTILAVSTRFSIQRPCLKPFYSSGWRALQLASIRPSNIQTKMLYAKRMFPTGRKQAPCPRRRALSNSTCCPPPWTQRSFGCGSHTAMGRRPVRTCNFCSSRGQAHGFMLAQRKPWG